MSRRHDISWSHSYLPTCDEDAQTLGVPSMNKHNNLLSFLAILQYYDIDFVDVRWGEGMEPIGFGATAVVQERFVSDSRGLAFKRHRALASSHSEQLENNQGGGSETNQEKIFNQLVSELTILGYPTIRNHQNIVHLEGVYWEVSSDNSGPCPVLMLERAELGDLWSFAGSPLGRQTSLRERISICLDIATAISALHEIEMIHGDIKPQNILLFKQEAAELYPEMFFAKLTDFGYAGWNLDPNTDGSLYLPRSRPWEAPEYHHQLDIFSLECTHEVNLNAAAHGLDFEAVGYHHDLRPANILVGKGTFVLTDFGLSKLKSADVMSQTGWKKFGCLMIEMVTYMDRSCEGLSHFRQSRLAELLPGFNTTYFFGKDGRLAEAVRVWFEEPRSTSSTKFGELLHIAQSCLDPQPQSRPKISHIRRELGIYALRFLSKQVLDKFTEYLQTHNADDHAFSSMQWWFERERLGVFSKALCSSGNTKSLEAYSSVESFQQFSGVLVEIFSLLHPLLDIDQPRESSEARIETKVDLRGSTYEQIQRLIQKLWDLSPACYSRKEQAAWIGSLQQKDVNQLNNIDQVLAFHRRKELVDLDAMAHMRARQLKMVHEPKIGNAELLHPRQDIDDIRFMNGHHYAQYKGSTQVLVEWMYYRPEWTKIPTEQRLIVMDLRAKGFHADPKPQGLRILRCLGFFEQKQSQNRRDGYGFIYELPNSLQSGDRYEPPITLRQLLILGVDPKRGVSSQAPLRGRFRLAHALSIFFEAFYGVGCLHETFNSNNVLFSRTISEMLASSNSWDEAYVAGFQKSRPDGQGWATEGPSDDRSFHDYEHPDYTDKGRFLLEYDYYSLGLVLLEVGLWCPLQNWSRKSEHQKLKPAQFRNVLLEKYVPRLAVNVGERYRDVVKTCLDGTLERKNDEMSVGGGNRKVFDRFAEGVVLPLEELSQLLF